MTWSVVVTHCHESNLERSLNAQTEAGWDVFSIHRTCTCYVIACRRRTPRPPMTVAARELCLLLGGLAVGLLVCWIACRR